MALTLCEFAHEIPVVDSLVVVTRESGFVAGGERCLGKQVATRPLGIAAEPRQSDPGDSYVIHG
jgi:hypothetical protein